MLELDVRNAENRGVIYMCASITQKRLTLTLTLTLSLFLLVRIRLTLSKDACNTYA
jgi:hypothetical protein